MRIHWAFVVLAMIGTILITWHLRTKDMHFLVPAGVELPPAEETPSLADNSPSLQPEIDDQPIGEPSLLEIPVAPPEPEIPEIAESDLGDLEASPGLDEYRRFAKNNPPDRLFELSSTLRARGHFQRALLAIERVVDTSEPDSELLIEASKGIAALTPTLPRWNIDPESQIPLNLHLSLGPVASEPLKKAMLDVALLIHESSGDQLDIIPKITSNETPETPAEISVALWLSSTDENPISSSVIILSLPGDESSLQPELARALFKAIRSHLERLSFPPVADLNEPGPKLLAHQITRLMWRDFALSLAPSKEEEEEEEEEEEATETTEAETTE